MTRFSSFLRRTLTLLAAAMLLDVAAVALLTLSVSLTIASVPFFARLVEASLREVHPGKVDAAHAMGSTRPQTVWKVLIPESLPSLVASAVLRISRACGKVHSTEPVTIAASAMPRLRPGTRNAPACSTRRPMPRLNHSENASWARNARRASGTGVRGS